MADLCVTCGRPVHFDRKLCRTVCQRCGVVPVPATPPAPSLVRGVEVTDRVDGRLVSRYMMEVAPAPAREPSRVYLRALYSMKLPEGGALRDALLGERFPRVPAPVRRALGEGLRLWGRLRRVGRRFERRPGPVWPNAPGPAASRPSAGLGVDAPPETARLHGAPPAARVPR